jgi:hypothetical protein
MEKLILLPLKEKFAVCHFDKKSKIPDWLKESVFYFVGKTDDELSIICQQEKIPGGVLAEKNWKAFKVKGPLGFTLTGVVSSISKPLADAKISILYVSTYETDYIFVEEKNFEKAKEILSKFFVIAQ